MIAKGNHAQALAIIPQIMAQGLLIHTAMMGTAAYGFYLNMIPSSQGQKPMVVFEVDDQYVERIMAPLPNKLPQYAFIKMYDRHNPNLTHVPIRV